MVSWNSKPYSGQVDLQKMVDLVHAARPAHLASAYPGVADLHELMLIPEICSHTCLWESHGEILAYALVDLWHNLWFDLLPEFQGSPLEDEIVQWGIACLRDLPAEEDPSADLSLDTNCYADDRERVALLLRHSFAQSPLQTVQMVRFISDPLPAPQLPAGFFFRTAAGESEADALAELHRAAFGTDEMTAEYRLAMMQTPGYDPALDLLAVDPIGRLAAFCVCHADPDSNGSEGFTDPLGVHPAYRRRGLARALLLEGMRRLNARGVRTVRLDTTSDNPAMLAAARSVGFEVEKIKLWFSKAL